MTIHAPNLACLLHEQAAIDSAERGIGSIFTREELGRGEDKLQVLLLVGSDDTVFCPVVLFPVLASERQQLHLLEYVVLSKGKSAAVLSLAHFSNVAAQNLFFNAASLCHRPQVLFSFYEERNAGFNFHQFFCPSFVLYTREERGDGGGKPYPPYFFLFIQYRSAL